MIIQLANKMSTSQVANNQENGAHFQQINGSLDALEARTTNLESRVATTEAHWEASFTSAASGSLKGMASKPYDHPSLSEIPKPTVELASTSSSGTAVGFA